MKDETVREWGIIHPLGVLDIETEPPTQSEYSPTPKNLIYHFSTALRPRCAEIQTSQIAVQVIGNAALQPLSVQDEPKEDGEESVQAISILYGHPRFVEYPDERIASKRTVRPLIPIILLAASIFVILYIYHLTTQKLRLQAENQNNLQALAHEKQAQAALVAPQVKVLTFQEPGENTVQAKLFWETAQQTGQLYFNNLPKTGPKEVFHLWYFTREAQFLPATSFKAVNGAATIRIKLPQEDAHVERIILSVEPLETYPFPTGKILLRGALQ